VNSITPADICVLIPCYNNLEGLKKSIDSIRYAKKGLYILVIDDGSNVPVELSTLSSPFAITVVRMPANSGIITAMNAGLQWIHTHHPARYIARLDCGDTCMAERFDVQAEYLDSHPSTGLTASWCRFENKNDHTYYIYTTPEHHAGILNSLPYRNVFIHPTVMFRSSLLPQTGLYPYEYPYAEDYALFWTMALHCETYIFPRVLVNCEWNPEGISISNRRAQLNSRKKIVKTFAKGPKRLAGIVRLTILSIVPYAWIIRLKRK